MRKIEQEMNRAIRDGKDWKNGNTEVKMVGDVARVRLYGNLIAQVGPDWVWICDQGYQTVTTKSRLNAVLRENGAGEGICQKDWRWILCRPSGPDVSMISGAGYLMHGDSCTVLRAHQDPSLTAEIVGDPTRQGVPVVAEVG
jgi:hypothetical protein